VEGTFGEQQLAQSCSTAMLRRWGAQAPGEGGGGATILLMQLCLFRRGVDGRSASSQQVPKHRATGQLRGAELVIRQTGLGWMANT
jgi:hypothetical protein